MTRHRGTIERLALAAMALAAGRGLANETVTPVLEADPAIVKLLSDLGDNSSATLPNLGNRRGDPIVNTTGDINDVAKRFDMHLVGPGVRDYCIKMVWMPDRKRAVFYGANHGAPHRTNDVWEYDLLSNTWICLYGPDLLSGTENWDRYLDRDTLKSGIPRTHRGGPAINAHTWWQLAYDPGIKAMLTFCSWSMIPKHVRDAQSQGNHNPPLWAFYPEQRKWAPIVGSEFKGRKPRYHNARSFEYIPSLKATVWHANSWAGRGMWAYDSAANTWTDLGRNAGDAKAFETHAPGPEQVMAVLPDRNMKVGHRADTDKKTGRVFGRTSHYCVESNVWTTAVLSTPEEPAVMPRGHDARTNFAYDPVGKVVLLWDRSDSQALWAYDPDTTTWTKLEPNGPPPPTKGRNASLAYYDVARNVLVIPGYWVYRYKKAE